MLFCKKNEMESKELLNSIVDLMDNKKSEDITVINVGDVSNLTEYLVLCCGNSNIHIKTISKWLRFKIKEIYGIYPLSIDGNYPLSDWIVMDFNDVIVHIMSREKRDMYKIEEFWNKEIRNIINK